MKSIVSSKIVNSKHDSKKKILYVVDLILSTVTLRKVKDIQNVPCNLQEGHSSETLQLALQHSVQICPMIGCSTD